MRRIWSPEDLAQLLADMARHPSSQGALQEAVEADRERENSEVADVIDIATKRRLT